MVYHVLELYLKQKKSYREQRMQIGGMKIILGITYICLIVLSILSIVSLFINSYVIFISEITTFIVLLIAVVINDHKNIKKSNDRIKAYEDFLKELKKSLNTNRIDWSTDNRLDYLISECNRVIDNSDKKRKNFIRCVEVIMLPIAKTVIDVMQANSKVFPKTDIIVGIFVVIALVLALIVVVNTIAAFIDLLLKTGSITEMKNLRNTLNDLKHYSIN